MISEGRTEDGEPLGVDSRVGLSLKEPTGVVGGPIEFESVLIQGEVQDTRGRLGNNDWDRIRNRAIKVCRGAGDPVSSDASRGRWRGESVWNSRVREVEATLVDVRWIKGVQKRWQCKV